MIDITFNGYEPEDDPPEQPRCACGAFLSWQHTSTSSPVEGVTQYIWLCRKCGGSNFLIEYATDAAMYTRNGGDLPF